MHIKHIHKHADFQGFGIAIRVYGAFHHHNATIGRANHGIGGFGDITRWVAEKIHAKQGKYPKWQRPPATQKTEKHTGSQATENKRPALLGNNGVRIVTVHRNASD